MIFHTELWPSSWVSRSNRVIVARWLLNTGNGFPITFNKLVRTTIKTFRDVNLIVKKCSWNVWQAHHIENEFLATSIQVNSPSPFQHFINITHKHEHLCSVSSMTFWQNLTKCVEKWYEMWCKYTIFWHFHHISNHFSTQFGQVFADN